MKIFYEAELSDFLQNNSRKMQSEVLEEDRNQLLNCNEVEYIQYLLSKYTEESLEFDWEKKYLTDREENINGNDYGKVVSYVRQVITCHVPYKGNSHLLRFRPSSGLLWSVEITINTHKQEISFDIFNCGECNESIKKDIEIVTDNIQSQLANVIKQIDQYNDNLESKITQKVRLRKDKLLKQLDLLGSLGIPIKKSPNVPDTFAIPTPQKKIIITKPVSSNISFKPEPTLDSAMYNNILKICQHTGVQIERLPSIYNGKNEETLRDHFLMNLSSHFENATGETFNKNGKTDILIRHEGNNAFIAECKFWKGIKSYHKTIDQLLSYLTWRDSKAAILFFIKNEELMPVLKQIETETSEHKCFVKYEGKTEESQFKFHFHLKDDNTRGVELAVLCFHFPRINKYKK